MQIRTASGEDAFGIAELLSAAGVQVSPGEISTRLGAVLRSSGTALVAVEWGPPSGFAVVHWGPTLDHADPVARISALLVRSDDRRRGIGRMLLKAASQAARQVGCAALHLTVPHRDDGLRDFCRATGFAETGTEFGRPLRRRS